jgi:nucleoid DNA-binding protein
MNKRDLTDLIAKRSKIKKSKAAEQVSRMVHEIISTLRAGQPATLPGLGHFEPGPTPKFRFEQREPDEKSSTDL